MQARNIKKAWARLDHLACCFICSSGSVVALRGHELKSAEDYRSTGTFPTHRVKVSVLTTRLYVDVDVYLSVIIKYNALNTIPPTLLTPIRPRPLPLPINQNHTGNALFKSPTHPNAPSLNISPPTPIFGLQSNKPVLTMALPGIASCT